MFGLTSLDRQVYAANSRAVLVLGDSLSAAYGIETGSGWVELFRQRLANHCTECSVVNASISGETTDGGARRLPELLQRHRPRWVIIELGANDGLRGFPLEVIKQNLTALVSLSQQAGAQPVLVGMHIPPNYGPAYTDRFHALFEQVATTLGAPRVPFLLDGVYDQPGMIQEDGLHPTALAQPQMADNVWTVFSPLLNE